MPSEGPRPDAADAFCVMPFVHLHITHHGTVTPCCQAPTSADLSFGNINEQPIEAIWNGPALQRFRNRMLAGERDERCVGCYSKEDVGWVSLRNITNNKYAEQARLARNGQGASATAPVYIDIRFSNHCNLRCRICGPTSSSAWHQDAVALGWLAAGSPARSKATADPAQLWQQLRSLASGLEEVYFAGGEPLLMEEHYQLLEMLLELGNTKVRLQYNSNFSTLEFKSWRATDLWRHFSDVTLSASLDGMGTRGEYQRSNQRWADVQQNSVRLRSEAPHVKLLITPTVSVFNVLHLPEFNRAVAEAGMIEAFDFIPSLLVRPADYSAQILPDALKAEARRRIEAHLVWLGRQVGNEPQRSFVLQQWGNVLRYMDAASTAHLIPDFLTKTAVLDGMRRENFFQTFPELAPLATS